ncbi:MAG: hypothetical protein IMF17_05130 [Proteobacteria bacterium]|nr:hypothetical protein [Pseudomonadota bacterium]
MKKYFSVLLLSSLTGSAFAVAPINTDVSAGYTYDDNVTRAELDQDIETDSVLNVDASAAYKIPVNNISYFSLGGTLEVDQYLDFSKLSNTRLGLHGSYFIRPSAGYTAIRYFAKLSYEQRLYSSEQRDGSATEVSLGLSKRLTDLLAMRLGFIKQDISANSAVFDADNSRYYIDLDYKTTKNNIVYLTLGYIDGDVVSTAARTDGLVASSSAIVRDDAFLGLEPARFAYKLAAKTTTISIGDNFTVGSNQSIDASLQYYKSESDYYDPAALADINISYVGLIYNLNYLYRF